MIIRRLRQFFPPAQIMTDLGAKAVLSNDLLLMRLSVFPSSLMSNDLISKEISFYKFLEGKQDSFLGGRHVACDALFEP